MTKKQSDPSNEEFIATSEDTHDDVELEEEETTSNQKIKSLRDKHKACEAEKRLLQEELQRARAEFLNSKKRLTEQLETEKTRLTDAHLTKLLPLCDSFDMAMGNTEVWQSVDETWRKGVEGIYAQLNSILKQYEVRAIDPTGEAFDPERHEAISTVDTDDTPSETVIEVVQKGYERNGTIIRPAKVILSN